MSLKARLLAEASRLEASIRWRDWHQASERLARAARCRRIARRADDYLKVARTAHATQLVGWTEGLVRSETRRLQRCSTRVS